MAVAAKRPSPAALLGPVIALALAGGFMAWRVQLKAVDQQIEQKRKAMKNLHLAGRIPPNDEVMAYLTKRTETLKAAYERGLALVALVPAPADPQSDPQLLVQERMHAVHNTLSRLATARAMPEPSLLGMPKELPPAEVAPRFVLQLKLIEETAELIMGIESLSALVSFKMDDPEPVTVTKDSSDPFLLRLPVSIRFVGTLDAVTQILGVLGSAKPMIDVRGVRMAKPATAEPAAIVIAAGEPEAAIPSSTSTKPPELETEIVLARYLVTAIQPASPSEAGDDAATARGARGSNGNSGAKASAQDGHGQSR